MSNTPESQPKLPRISPGLVGVGILVIALGFGLPMLTSGSVPINFSPQSTPKQATASGKPAEPTSSSSDKSQAATDAPPPNGLGVALLRLAIGLAVVCGLCILVARWVGQKSSTTPTTMEVLASIVVARCVVHLVRAGDRRLLIGTDIAGVKAILELPGLAPEPPLSEPFTAESSAPAEKRDSPSASVSPSAPPAPSTPLAPSSPLTQDTILKLLSTLTAQRSVSPPG